MHFNRIGMFGNVVIKNNKYIILTNVRKCVKITIMFFKIQMKSFPVCCQSV